MSADIILEKKKPHFLQFLLVETMRHQTFYKSFLMGVGLPKIFTIWVSFVLNNFYLGNEY